MKILLDTSFILTCIKQKIDFPSLADEIFDEKIEWLYPFEVEQELKKISVRKGEKTKDKLSAKVSLEFIKTLNPKKIKLNNENVDMGIVEYAEKNKVIIATLDKELKSKTKSRILTIRNHKNISLI